ncbi:MAG: hypothetical protein Q8M76_09165, partial [Spirochaetaceae bacterium]|nr:hypothetical protein [Spirochaetaceae bacterium]
MKKTAAALYALILASTIFPESLPRGELVLQKGFTHDGVPQLAVVPGGRYFTISTGVKSHWTGLYDVNGFLVREFNNATSCFGLNENEILLVMEKKGAK